MPSELCKSCIHTKVCLFDKNLIGDVFVMGNPDFFDNEKLYEEYKKREENGFPCNEYLAADAKPVVRGEWEEIEIMQEVNDISGERTWASKMRCNKCGFVAIAIEGHFSQYHFCPNCGAEMVRGEQDE